MWQVQLSKSFSRKARGEQMWQRNRRTKRGKWECERKERCEGSKGFLRDELIVSRNTERWFLVKNLSGGHTPFNTSIFYLTLFLRSLACKSSFPRALWVKLGYPLQLSEAARRVMHCGVTFLRGYLFLLSWSQQQFFSTVCISELSS